MVQPRASVELTLALALLSSWKSALLQRVAAATPLLLPDWSGAEAFEDNVYG